MTTKNTDKANIDGHFITLMEEAKLDSQLMDWCELAETIIDIEFMIEETKDKYRIEQYKEILKVYEEEKESRIPPTNWQIRYQDNVQDTYFDQYEDISD